MGVAKLLRAARGSFVTGSTSCVSLVKNEYHQPKNILGDKVHVDYHRKDILLTNSKAHRFAINYHNTLHNKAWQWYECSSVKSNS